MKETIMLQLTIGKIQKQMYWTL